MFCCPFSFWGHLQVPKGFWGPNVESGPETAPGRSIAGSTMSGRLVAAMTKTWHMDPKQIAANWPGGFHSKTAMEMPLTPQHKENIKSTMMEGSSCLKPPTRPANGIARHPFPSTSGSRPSKLWYFGTNLHWHPNSRRYLHGFGSVSTRFSKFKTRSEEPLPSDDLQQNKGSYHGPTPELSLKLYLWEAPPPILNSWTHPVLFGTRASSSSKNITP